MANLESLFIQNLGAHPLVVIGLGFAGGVVSTLSPCTIGMLPILVGYMGAHENSSKKDIIQQVLLFIVGLSTVMTLLGVAAGILGVTFGGLIGGGWYYLLGGLAIVLGLQLLDVIQLPLPQTLTKFPETDKGKLLTPFIMGLAFGITASPCGTPFLAGILSIIAKEGNIPLGAVSLFMYAMGQGAIIFVIGVSTGILKHMATIRQTGAVLNKLSAGVFILAGLFLISQPSGLLDAFLTWLSGLA